MNPKQWNEWRSRRTDEPGFLLPVSEYITDSFPSDEWHARQVEFVEEVEAQAKEVYDRRGPTGLEEERTRIDDVLQEKREQLRRVRLKQSGVELIDRLRSRYRGCQGRVIEDLRVVPRGAYVPAPDGMDGVALRAPPGPLVLRPQRDRYVVEPTVRVLEGNDMPTDALMRYSFFSVFRLSAEDTWEDVTALVEEQVEYRTDITRKTNRELKRLRARRSVYDALVERRAKGRPMPWEHSGSEQTAAQQHTITIGTALLRADFNGDRSSFGGQKTMFKRWASQQIERSPSTAYDAMVETGCWVNSRQGRTDADALDRTIDAVKEFAEEHSSQDLS